MGHCDEGRYINSHCFSRGVKWDTSVPFHPTPVPSHPSFYFYIFDNKPKYNNHTIIKYSIMRDTIPLCRLLLTISIRTQKGLQRGVINSTVPNHPTLP